MGLRLLRSRESFTECERAGSGDTREEETSEFGRGGGGQCKKWKRATRDGPELHKQKAGMTDFAREVAQPCACADDSGS